MGVGGVKDASWAQVSCCSVVHGACVGVGEADGYWWDCGCLCGEEGLCDRSPIAVWAEGKWEENSICVEEVIEYAFNKNGAYNVCNGVTDVSIILHELLLFDFLQV